MNRSAIFSRPIYSAVCLLPPHRDGVRFGSKLALALQQERVIERNTIE
jgi:hypothetical protein